MKIIFLSIIIGSMSLSTFASDEHDHKSKKVTQKVEQHEEEHDHGHKDEVHKEHNHGKGHSDDDGHGHDKEHDDEHDHESAHGDEHEHEHGGGKAIGEGKAIVDVNEVKGFKLSPEAIKTIGIKLETVSEAKFKIAKNTLVASKDKKGIYRFEEGYFKFIPVQIKNEMKDGYLIEVVGLDFGDQIVVDGVGLLRVADVYSTDKSEYGHSH